MFRFQLSDPTLAAEIGGMWVGKPSMRFDFGKFSPATRHQYERAGCRKAAFGHFLFEEKVSIRPLIVACRVARNPIQRQYQISP